MNNEEVVSIGHILGSLKDNLRILDESMKSKDIERFNSVKKEMIKLTEEINKII